MKVGFTTSFPVETVFAAGHIPVDLNNIFITGKPLKDIEKAEYDGFPRNICAWIKGMYGTIVKNNIDVIIGIVEGDCSNTHALMSNLSEKDFKIIPFSFPYSREYDALQKEILKLEDFFQVSHKKVLAIKNRLDKIRKKLIILDKLTYEANKVSGAENHYWLVNSSDFNGNPDKFETELDKFIETAKKRKPFKYKTRLAFLGVPPIFSDLYEFLLEFKTNVVFNEIQRQFSMPYLCNDIVEQYRRYTYPYSIFHRLEDIKKEIQKRKIDGVISYAQAFCHRQIDNILIKKHCNKPVLTLEGDQPGPLDARTKLRIESFLDMLEY